MLLQIINVPGNHIHIAKTMPLWYIRVCVLMGITLHVPLDELIAEHACSMYVYYLFCGEQQGFLHHLQVERYDLPAMRQKSDNKRNCKSSCSMAFKLLPGVSVLYVLTLYSVEIHST